MCGIVGFIGNGNEAILQRMCNSLSHRGPDGSGFYIDYGNQVYLGHRRLAIIDLVHGHQPMWNQDKDLCVVFNGEIYNHQILKKTLIKFGHHFQTDHSDTEVLLHGYKQWNDDLPKYLNGMFAFAIYDIKRKKIFIARDRFGKKPLYFFQQKEIFGFASELKAFFVHPEYQNRLNIMSLKKFFAYGFLPAPNCQYVDTYKLPGGHSISYDLFTKQIIWKKYWEFILEPDDKYFLRNENEIGEELIYLLEHSVRRRLMSDVPLGILLSGGIDSSAVLAMATRVQPKNSIKTYSMSFSEKSFDESYYAKKIANFFNVIHHEKNFDFSDAQLLTTVLSNLDEPLGDSSILATFLVCQFARQDVTVVLGGDGGDELFAGYDPFRALKFASLYKKVTPSWLHQSLVRLAELMPISTKNMSLNFKLQRFLRGLNFPQSYWNPIWLSSLMPHEIQELFNEPVALEELYSEALCTWESTKSDNIIDKSLEFYTKLYLQDNILTKIDRASMMASLEYRAPFLDLNLVDFARKLPSTFKYKNGVSKYILKKALKNILPDCILARPKKGFGIPLSRWLQCQSFEIPIKEIGSSNPIFVASYVNAHRQKKADHRLFLWSWLVASSQILS